MPATMTVPSEQTGGDPAVLEVRLNLKRNTGLARPQPAPLAPGGWEIPKIRAQSGPRSAVPAARDACARLQVLQSLVEDFGGEATCAHLSERMTSWPLVPGLENALASSWVRDTLDELDARGEVTLETDGPATLIARITLAGADAAHG
jgi:hypothetical protein